MKDIIIIGSGITGSLIAYELSHYNLDILVLEKSNDVANGATGANSAIIHSGHDPLPNTLKAKYNLEGNRLFPTLCKDLKVAYKQVGALVVACGKEEEEKLDVLVKQCIDRDVPYEILDGVQAHIAEPNLSDEVSMALSLPSTGIVTPWEVAIAAMEEALLNNAELKLEEEVLAIEKNDTFKVTTNKGTYEAKVVINCAGVHADDISAMLNIHKYKITPRKGEYYILDHQKKPFVNTIIYPIPSEKGKGILAVPTIHNNILIGPNSDFKDDKDRVNTETGLNIVRRDITKTLKNIPWNLQIHTYAGNRPTGDLHDFVIEEDTDVTNFFHVACIESPGLASSPAIAKEITRLVTNKLEPSVKETFVKRKAHINMSELTDEEKDALIKENPDYGKMICRCEKISLGEIKDVIHRKCGATSVKGVKKRCRPGMGRCQGGFCEVEVVKILEKELGISTMDVVQSGKDSNILCYVAKEVQ